MKTVNVSGLLWFTLWEIKATESVKKYMVGSYKLKYCRKQAGWSKIGQQFLGADGKHPYT